MRPVGSRYTYIWAFRVRAGCEPAFERLYGPDGEWVRLFRKADGYLHTELHRDIADTRRYVTVDYWTSEAAFDAFRRACADAFRILDERGEALTEEETPLGSFTSVAPAEG